MKRALAATLALTAFLALACDSGGSDDAGSGSEDDLRATYEEAVTAFIDADFDAFYGHFSDDFQERCDKQDFDRIMAIAMVFLGDALDEAEFDIEEVRIDDDGRGYVTASVTGPEGLAGDSEGDLTDFWVYEDGAWKADTNDQEPCDIDGDFNGDIDNGDIDTGDIDTGDDDEEEHATPEATGPGTSRAEAVPLGESVSAGDLEVTVVSFNPNAEATDLGPGVSEPPAAGRKYVLVTVRVRHAGEGEETVDVSSSDYKLTGSNNVVYDGFDDLTSCGFVESELRAELFPGGEAEGQICFEVPEDETDLILIVQPFFSFEDEDRRYLRLD